MKTILALILFMTIGFLGSKGWVSRGRSKFFAARIFSTGMEFFFLGIVLGPAFLNLISPGAQEELKPLVYLALGWIGLLFGMQFSWLQLKRVSSSVFKMITADSLLFTAAFTVISFPFLYFVLSIQDAFELFKVSIILALTASINSPTFIAMLTKGLKGRGGFISAAKLVTSLYALVPLLLFGLYFIIVRPATYEILGVSNWAVWWVFANMAGILLGFVMVLLTAQKCGEDERMLLIIGLILVVGGLSYFFRLSSLYTSMLMGFVVGNFSRRKEQIFKQLIRLEKTIYIMFLVLVGAMISFSSVDFLVLLGFYYVLRILLKLALSGEIFRRCFPEIVDSRGVRGLIFGAQGGMALAMALDYGLSAGGALSGKVTTAVVFAVVFNELSGYYLTRKGLSAGMEKTARAGGVREET